MPDPNRLIEGFEYIDYPSNFGNNFGGYEFPDSLAADYMGGLNSLFFTGKNAQGQSLDHLDYPSEVSGNYGPDSPLYGLKGFIYMPVNNPPSLIDSFIIHLDHIGVFNFMFRSENLNRF